MVTVTCKSIITYENLDERFTEPFLSERAALAQQMFAEGKTNSFPNDVSVNGVAVPGQRVWVDQAAAQEFIDFVLLNAPTYNINITSASIGSIIDQ
jgi:hypothetical protein